MNPEEEPTLESSEEKLAELEAGPVAEPPARRERGWEDNPLVAWGRAIALGLKDTANDVLDTGRQGAHDKSQQMWDRFRTKTKERRPRR